MKTGTVRKLLDEIRKWQPTSDRHSPRILTAKALRGMPPSEIIRSSSTLEHWAEIVEAIDAVRVELELDELEGKP